MYMSHCTIIRYINVVRQNPLPLNAIDTLTGSCYIGRTGMKEREMPPITIHVVEKKSSLVAKWVIDAIKEGKWSVGDRLPPERAIAEQLGVSRTAVREALSSLHMVDLIEPRVGDGNYLIRSIEAETDIEDALEAIAESESLVEVWTIRKMLEIIIAKLALRKAREEDIDELERCFANLEQAVENVDPDTYLTTNSDFHRALAGAAKNPFLKRSVLPLVEITEHQLAQQVTKDTVRAHKFHLVDMHRKILDAIEHHDDKHIVEIMSDHFKSSEAVFLKEA